jgi:hypothetical protein
MTEPLEPDEPIEDFDEDEEADEGSAAPMEVVYEPVDLDEFTGTARSEPSEESVKPEEKTLSFRQEETRGGLAQCLVILLAATSSAMIGYSIFYSEDENVSENLMTLVWTSQVGLVGGALGFYFGQNSVLSPEQRNTKNH